MICLLAVHCAPIQVFEVPLKAVSTPDTTVMGFLVSSSRVSAAAAAVAVACASVGPQPCS
jgi:hypothetical protein